MAIESLIAAYGVAVAVFTSIVSLDVRNSRPEPRPPNVICQLIFRIPPHSRPYIATILIAGGLIALITSSLFDLNLLSYQQIVRKSIANPRDTNEGMYLFMELRSPTFSANMPIKADIYLHINQTYRMKNSLSDFDNLPESYSILFLGTYCEKDFRFVVPGHCLTDLMRFNSYEFQGHTTINYSHGGSFGVVLSNNNGLAGTTRLDEGIIHVSSTDGANDFRTFKMSIVIGIIASAIGTLALLQRRQT